MKRVLSLVLALVMVLGTIVPAFAEETMTKTPGEELKGYGLIDGTDKGLEEDQPLQRAQMAVILAKMYGKAEEAKPYALPSSFTDVDKDAWYAPWVAYAQAQKWMVGADSKFRPMDNLSAQEINVLMVKVLGYEAKWETANEDAATYKVAVDAKDKSLVLRGEIFKAMTTTLDQPKKGETETLGTALKLTGYTAPVPPTPEKLEVAKVTTDNLLTVVVEFNQELDKKTVNTTNFKVSGLTVSKVTLGEDKKTVTLEMSSEITQSKEIELVISKVKDVTGDKTIADYKEKHLVNDVTVPVIEGVSVIDAKSVKVMASEPMNWNSASFTVLSGVKIDDKTVIATVTPDHAKKEYTITFNSVKADGTYKIAIEGQKDFAKLAAVKKEFTFTIAKDDKAPVATKAEMKATNEVWVTFDEPVNTIGSITINGKATTETYADSTKKVVKAVFTDANDKLDLGATVEVIVKYKGQKDVVGNEVKTETQLTFKVEDDTTLPTATLAVEKANKIVITFSKAMDVKTGKVIVLDKDKKVKKEFNVDGLGTWNTEKTVLTLVATDLDSTGLKLSDTDPVTSYIQLKTMKDSTVRANQLATVDLQADLLDTKKPVVADKYVVTNGTKTGADLGKDDTITFYFSEAMDEDTIKNLSNYLENDANSLAAMTGVAVKSVASDKKSVVITYPQARSLGTAIKVAAVKDIAGNMSASKSITKAAGAEAITSYAAEASSTTQVKVTFTQDIKSVDPAALAIYKGSTAHTTVSSVASISGKVVTLNLVSAIGTDTANYQVRVMNKSLIKTVYDAAFTGVDNYEMAITDKVAPTVKAMNDGKWDTAPATHVITATKNMAVIEMSEELSGFSLTPADWVVKLDGKVLDTADYTMALAGAGADAKYINITINPTAKVTLADKYTLEVELVRLTDVKDAAGNKTAVFTKSISDLDYGVKKVIYTSNLVETSVNDGAIGGSIVATLVGDTFVGTNGAAMSNVSVATVPTGLTAVYTKTSDTKVTITFTGKATSHANADDANVVVTFTADAFTNTTDLATIADEVSGNQAVDFNDPLAAPSLTADTTDNNVDNNIVVTFADNTAWRSAVTAVTFDGQAIDASAITWAAGTLTLNPANDTDLQTAKTANIVVTATGYANATVSQAITAGAVSTSNSVVAGVLDMASNTVQNINIVARDKFNNAVSGYTFKYTVTMTDTDATTDESFTIDGDARTADLAATDIKTATNAAGQVTLTVGVPATVDNGDGVSIQVYLNNGTTVVGSAVADTK